MRVALSDDGQTLAVGAFGQARVYAAPASVPVATTAWTLLGAATAAGERGVPVALSADGTVLATGAYDVASANEGVAQVRAWDAISNTWQPVWTCTAGVCWRMSSRCSAPGPSRWVTTVRTREASAGIREWGLNQ